MAETELPHKEIHINHNGGIVTVLVDADDYPLLSRHTWYIRSTTPPNNPYPATTLPIGEGRQKKENLRIVAMHYFIMGVGNIDHENLNTLDNRKRNLRKATHQQNGWNRGKNRLTAGGRTPNSQFKGVTKYINKHGEAVWNVQIRLTAKGVKPTKHLWKRGFKSEIEAAKFYNQEIVKLRGKFAWVNPIPGEDSNANQ